MEARVSYKEFSNLPYLREQSLIFVKILHATFSKRLESRIKQPATSCQVTVFFAINLSQET